MITTTITAPGHSHRTVLVRSPQGVPPQSVVYTRWVVWTVAPDEATADRIAAEINAAGELTARVTHT